MSNGFNLISINQLVFKKGGIVLLVLILPIIVYLMVAPDTVLEQIYIDAKNFFFENITICVISWLLLVIVLIVGWISISIVKKYYQAELDRISAEKTELQNQIAKNKFKSTKDD